MPKRACICFTTNPETVPAMYLFSAPNPGNAGNTKAFRSDDLALTERWIKAENRPGFAVYHCPNPLKPGATTHGKDSIDAIAAIFVDIDFKVWWRRRRKSLRCSPRCSTCWHPALSSRAATATTSAMRSRSRSDTTIRTSSACATCKRC